MKWLDKRNIFWCTDEYKLEQSILKLTFLPPKTEKVFIFEYMYMYMLFVKVV